MENKGAGGFDEIDDGRYMAIISDSDVNESQASDRLQMMLEFKIEDGEFQGKTKRMYVGLDNEMGIQITVNTLARLGIEVEDPSDLEERIKEAVGKICKIQLKTKSGKNGDFQNVYILKVMGTEPTESASSHEAVDEPEVEDEPVEDPKPAPKAKKGKEKSAPAPEPEPEEPTEEVVEEPVEEPETVELKVGMMVIFNLKKEEVEGKVTKIEEEQGTVIVEYKGKKYRVPADKLSFKQ